MINWDKKKEPNYKETIIIFYEIQVMFVYYTTT